MVKNKFIKVAIGLFSRILFVSIGLSLGHHLVAQDNFAIVTGTVKNSKGSPLPNVTITVSGINNFIDHSNSEGEYKLIIASNNVLTIDFSLKGYRNVTIFSPKLRMMQTYDPQVVLFTLEETPK